MSARVYPVEIDSLAIFLQNEILLYRLCDSFSGRGESAPIPGPAGYVYLPAGPRAAAHRLAGTA